MKKLFTLSVFAALLALSASAQKGRGHGKHVTGKHAQGKHDNQVIKDLNLDENQGQQVKAINQDIKSKREAIKNDQSLTQEQRHERMKALQQERKTKVQAILSAEQLEKIKNHKDDEHVIKTGDDNDIIKVNNDQPVKQDKKKNKSKGKGRNK